MQGRVFQCFATKSSMRCILALIFPSLGPSVTPGNDILAAEAASVQGDGALGFWKAIEEHWDHLRTSIRPISSPNLLHSSSIGEWRFITKI